jgi:hypothetical protein
MESSGPSGKTTNPVQSKWAGILGTFIAVMTLTIPLLAIAYNSLDLDNNTLRVAPPSTRNVLENR